MFEKIIIGGIGALLAIAIREIVVWYKSYVRGQKIAALCVKHLESIKRDLKKLEPKANKVNKRGQTQFTLLTYRRQTMALRMRLFNVV